MSSDRARKGDRYLVTAEFEAVVLTQWFAPFTGGDRRLLPVGLEFMVSADPPKVATAVSAELDPAGKWEEKDRTNEKYGGCSLVIPFDDLAIYCSRR
jgi:hypothetical protein